MTVTQRQVAEEKAVAQKLEPTPLACYLRTALARHGYKNHSLFARRAQISDQYLRHLLAGYNLPTDTVLEPSVRVIRRLARALAMEPRRGALEEELEAELEYARLIRAAGYSPNLDLVPHERPFYDPDPAAVRLTRTAEERAAERARAERQRLALELQAITRRIADLVRGDAPPLDQVDDPYLRPLDQQ